MGEWPMSNGIQPTTNCGRPCSRFGELARRAVTYAAITGFFVFSPMIMKPEINSEAAMTK